MTTSISFGGVNIGFSPSHYQTDIFNHVVETSENILVEALPGSGKTTTAVAAAKIAASLYAEKGVKASIAFVAFNKSIATEMGNRLGSSAKSQTLHSVGYSALRYSEKKARFNVDNYKLTKDFDRLIKKSGNLAPEITLFLTENKAQIVDVVAKAKNVGIGAIENVSEEAFNWVMDTYSIIPNVEKTRNLAKDAYSIFIKAAINLLSFNSNNIVFEGEVDIDFDDMLYLPIKYGSTFWQNDLVILDEAQDLNPLQIEMIRRIVKLNGRLIAVGDHNQSIYGFRGAANDAMDRIKAEFRCVVLPLSICYRCGTDIVNYAKKFVPEIESAPNAISGKVESKNEWSIDEFRSSGKETAILCRNVAPLVGVATKLLAAGIPCILNGRDIAKGLINLIKKMNARNIGELYVNIREYQIAETARLMEKQKISSVATLEDKVFAILAIADSFVSTDKVDFLISKIDSMFTDNTENLLLLSTVHKAKGGEWDKVYILDPQLMPNKFAKQSWERIQEKNIQFVAFTRAKKEMIFVRSDALSSATDFVKTEDTIDYDLFEIIDDGNDQDVPF